MNSKTITRKELCKMFDHTFLKAFCTKNDMKRLCQEALENDFAMVAISSSQVKCCKEFLKGSAIHVGAAISFPLGQTDLSVKLFETKVAIEQGADEIDYVINIGKLKENDLNYLEKEMAEIVALCHKQNVICKVIFENCYLEKSEMRSLIKIANKVKPDYIKTSTGFAPTGATFSDVKMMRELADEKIKIKAAGQIDSWEKAAKYIDLGVSRIGTSKTMKILKEYDNR